MEGSGISGGTVLAVSITVIIFMLGHLGGAIWFASRVNFQMTQFGKDIQALSVKLENIFKQDTRIAVLEARVTSLERLLTKQPG